MNVFSRTEQVLEKTIRSLEDLANSSALIPRQLEGMMKKLYEIRLAMQQLDKTDPAKRDKFWKLSRRAVSIAVKIQQLLSGS